MLDSKAPLILVVDDDSGIRAVLRLLMERDGYRVFEATTGVEAVSMFEHEQPDVVLMDIRMPRLDGLAATVAIGAIDNAPPVVILTTFDLDDFVFRALQAGAAGFLLKDTPPRELIQAVRVVANGDSMLSPSVTRRLIAHFAAGERPARPGSDPQRFAELTEREHEVMIEVGRGLSNADIGAALFMSEATVKAHVSRLLVKLGVANRVQIAILAHDAGLLDD